MHRTATNADSMAEFLRSELTEADTEEEDTTVASGYSA